MGNTTAFDFTYPDASDESWAGTMNDCIQEIDTLLAAHIFHTDGTMKDGAVDNTAALADSIVTAAKIVNRTRTWLVPAVASYNDTDLSVGSRTSIYGWYMPDSKTYSLYGGFYCPSDYASTMTVKAVVWPLGTGNIYCTHDAYVGANGEAANTHSYSQSATAVAVTETVINEISSLSLTAIATGDYVNLKFQRQGGNASDTVNAVANFIGWLVSYTADS